MDIPKKRVDLDELRSYVGNIGPEAVRDRMKRAVEELTELREKEVRLAELESLLRAFKLTLSKFVTDEFDLLDVDDHVKDALRKIKADVEGSYLDRIKEQDKEIERLRIQLAEGSDRYGD